MIEVTTPNIVDFSEENIVRLDQSKFKTDSVKHPNTFKLGNIIIKGFLVNQLNKFLLLKIEVTIYLFSILIANKSIKSNLSTKNRKMIKKPEI